MHYFEHTLLTSSHSSKIAEYVYRYCGEHSLRFKPIFIVQEKNVEKYLEEFDICVSYRDSKTIVFWFKDFYHGTIFHMGMPT